MSRLAHWYAATRTTPFTPGTLEEMRAAPNFRAALHTIALETLKQYDAEPELSRTLNDSARMNMGFFALYLDADGGLTLARIQALMSELGLSSRGRSAAFLIRLRMLGFVAAAATQRDKRSRLYEPTERLRRITATHLRAAMGALSLIEPEVSRLLPHLEEPRVFRRLMLDTGGGFIKAIKTTQAPPALQTFTNHNVGMILVYTLLTSAPDGSFPPNGPVPLTVSTIAKRYRLSRAHVQRLLQMGEKAGFFSWDKAGTVALHPSLFESLEQYYGFYFAGLAACAYVALNEMADA